MCTMCCLKFNCLKINDLQSTLKNIFVFDVFVELLKNLFFTFGLYSNLCRVVATKIP